MSRDRAFQVVADFEQALCDYTGSPFCVTTDSATNALFLAVAWWTQYAPEYPRPAVLSIPKHTYVGVRQAILNAGIGVAYRDEKWNGSYKLLPTNIVDSAKRFERGMYQPATLTCLSFQAGKILPIGRGGAVLTDNEDAAAWLRKARLDGRTAGVDYKDNTYAAQGWHMYLPPDAAARGLWLLTYIDDGDTCDWTEYPNLSEATWD